MKRTELVGIRFTKEELRKIKQRAKNISLTISGYIRFRALGNQEITSDSLISLGSKLKKEFFEDEEHG